MSWSSLAGWRFEAGRSSREQSARCVDSSGDFGLVGEIQLVLAGEHLVREVAQSIMSDSRVSFRAQYQSHRRVLVRMGPMLARVVQIQVHLTGIGVCELTEFQIHDYESPKAAVEENQINPVPFGSDAQPFLSSDECDIVAQFQKKLLEALNESIFEFRLRIFVLQIQEFEDEGVSHMRVSGQSLLLGRTGSCAAGSLVGKTGDLPVELTGRPATLQRLALIVFPCFGIGDGE